MLRVLVEFAHRCLPRGSTSFIRRCLPTRVKSWLGARLVSGISQGKIVVATDGRQFRPIDDGLFFRVFYEGVYEPELSMVLGQFLEAPDHVIDVGANFGWYATLFGKRVASGSVLAYEPMPATFEVLNDNIRLNELEGIVKTFRACVGERDDTVDMVITPDSGLAHVANKGEATGVVSTPMVTLDTHASTLKNQVSLIKVHVEGFELNVLKGAQSLLDADDQPIVQVKLNDARLADFGVDRREIVDFLVTRSYQIYEVAPNGRVLPAEGDTKFVEIFGVGKGRFGDRFKHLFSLESRDAEAADTGRRIAVK